MGTEFLICRQSSGSVRTVWSPWDRSLSRSPPALPGFPVRLRRTAARVSPTLEPYRQSPCVRREFSSFTAPSASPIVV